MALTTTQKKLNRLQKQLAHARYMRDNLIAYRVGDYWEWNNFSVAVKREDGTAQIIEGFFDGASARDIKNSYIAGYAASAKDLAKEIRELKKTI